jgi:hypothetical protein
MYCNFGCFLLVLSFLMWTVCYLHQWLCGTGAIGVILACKSILCGNVYSATVCWRGVELCVNVLYSVYIWCGI